MSFADELMVRWFYQAHKARHPLGPNRRRTTDHRLHPNARKATCPEGHPYDEANTKIRADGARRCRVCERRWERNRS